MTSPRLALLSSGLASFTALGAGMAMMGAALPSYETRFAIDTATSGVLVSTMWAACLCGVVTMYFASHRVTPRRALAGVVLGAVLLALAPSWALTLAGAAVFGFGYGLTAAVFNPRLLVSWEETGPAKVSMLNAVFSGGAILAPWAFAALGAGPQPIFWAMAVMAALGFGLAGRAGQVGQSARAEAGGLSLHLPILCLAVVGVGTEASLAGLGPSALIRAGVPEGQASSLLALFFLAAVVARVGLIFLAHRVPDFAVYLAAVAWASLCALGAIWAPGVFFPLIGVSAGLFFQGAFVTAVRKMGEDPRVSPIILGIGLVGAILAPLALARWLDALGGSGFFALVAGVTGAATLAALVLWRGMLR